VEIIEAHAMPDPIHMLLKIPPKISVSGFMGYLKGKSALMIFERHTNLKYRYGNRNFWEKGFFCKHSRVKYKSGRGLYKKPRKRKYGSR
jgi:transposase IS200-family protein